MDSKALAKSKRAHSRNLNRRHNPNPKSKPPSSQSGDAGNPSTATQKPPQRHLGAVPGLPSNWDRYADEEQPELGEGAWVVGGGARTSNSSSRRGKVEALDVPVPKSKGADYRYLVEEAKSQRQYRNRGDSSSYAVLSLDDTLPEFYQEAMSSLISIRGDAILSWCNDDKFAIEDESRPMPEVPFLSLNLNKLEEQLAKVDLAKRLFIDPDLLPQEWQSTSSAARSDMVSDKMLMRETEVTGRKVDKLSLNDLTKEEMDDDEIAKRNSGSWSLPTSSLNQVDSRMTKTYRSSEAASPVCTAQPTEVISLDERGNPALFEAGAAEAELDALLDSFGETKFVYPSSSGSSASILPSRQQNHVPLPQMSSQGLSSSGAMINDNIDAFLDDLLEETSMPAPLNHARDNLFLPKQVKAAPSHPLPDKTSKPNSTALNDFDSWLETI